MLRIATPSFIPTGDDVLLVIVPAEVSEVPVVRAPRRGHGRHAAVGVEVHVLDVGLLRQRTQSLLLHVELDLCHLGHPKTVAIFSIRRSKKWLYLCVENGKRKKKKRKRKKKQWINNIEQVIKLQVTFLSKILP